MLSSLSPLQWKCARIFNFVTRHTTGMLPVFSSHIFRWQRVSKGVYDSSITSVCWHLALEMDVKRMCGKPIRLFGTHRDTPNARSTQPMQHIFTQTHKHKNMHTKLHIYIHIHSTHIYIFNAHTNKHGWCSSSPQRYWIYVVLTFIPCRWIQAFQLFNNLFSFPKSFSVIASCVTVCDVSQPLPLVFKRFSKTKITFLLRKLDPISFSSALLIKERLGNLVLSNPKKEHGLSNNKLTHHVCIQYSYCCVFVHICVFDVYARCCVYFFAALCVFPICLHYVVSF